MLVEYAQNAEMVDVSGVMERADKYFMNNGGFAQPFLSTSGKYSLLKCEKETLFNK